MQDTIKSTYESFVQQYTEQYAAISRKHNNLSLLRLIIVLAVIPCLYFYASKTEPYLLCIILPLIALFIFLMQVHRRTAYQKLRIKTLLQLNKEELDYLSEGTLSFADGSNYKEEHHAYTADLDLFGHRSLYQHLNRTATQMGKDRLAFALQRLLPHEAIKENQLAVAELVQQLHARQEIYAAGRMAGDTRESYNNLLRWSAQEEKPVSAIMLLLCYLFPALLIGVLAIYAITRSQLYLDISLRLFPVNLFLFALMVRRIRKAVFGTEHINETLTAYAAMFLQIEEATYNSPHLQQLQDKLRSGGIQASIQLKKLAAIYKGMETIQNPFAAVVTNGLYLYHVHMLQRLSRWKKAYAAAIPQWLEVLGELEMLNSLANLGYNNPGFCYPELNREQVVSFKSLGHPLIRAEKRVCNDITFEAHRFIILTGSNMSGKSTFLRTLGVNMVLTGMGAPVCAAAANVHPLKVFVSMRQADSLADSESYFFAEVKRLKYIMDQMDKERCFVLLDEILRGTNSDDKRSGTIGVIEKIIRKGAIGAIATHDLEVCLTTDAHPAILSNKCFEVEIIDNELVFDYTLRNGICKNKSATFLMKKMEIIS